MNDNIKVEESQELIAILYAQIKKGVKHGKFI